MNLRRERERYATPMQPFIHTLVPFISTIMLEKSLLTFTNCTGPVNSLEAES